MNRVNFFNPKLFSVIYFIFLIRPSEEFYELKFESPLEINKKIFSGSLHPLNPLINE